MGRVSKKTTPKPPTARQRIADNEVLCLLADGRGRSARTIAERLSISEPTIRSGLLRLMMAQAVSRKHEEMTLRRGLPGYLYYITRQGEAALAAAAK